MFFVLAIFSLIIGFENGAALTPNVDPNLVFFYGNNVNMNRTYELSKAAQILKNPKFNRTKTVLYIFGYVESPASATVQSIVNAYIKRATYNILVLDWSTLVNGSYPTAVNNSLEVGPIVSKTLINLSNRGFNLRTLHIVGHSLGGQLAGIIGRSLLQLTNNRTKLRRISALDPAFPLFYPPNNVTIGISNEYAFLVDIIHTDADVYGAPVNTGCVDFVVNNGTRLQPGCPVGTFPQLSTNDTCSHQRSVALWAESVSNLGPTFLATSSKKPLIHMGIDCPLYARPGMYTVKTNAESPYSIA